MTVDSPPGITRASQVWIGVSGHDWNNASSWWEKGDGADLEFGGCADGYDVEDMVFW